jgi:hypothetical protein
MAAMVSKSASMDLGELSDCPYDAQELLQTFSLAEVVCRISQRGARHPFVPSAHLPDRSTVATQSLQRVSQPAGAAPPKQKSAQQCGASRDDLQAFFPTSCICEQFAAATIVKME